MPANSGAITGTIAHKHSAPSADGGFLDDNVTGVMGTANGSLVMFDGSSIAQDLPAGNLNDILTMGAAVPAWNAPAGGAPTELIDSVTLPVAAAIITSSFAAVNQSTVSKFFVVFNTEKSPDVSATVTMTINGINSATYDSQRIISNASGTGVSQSVNQAGANSWRFISNNHGDEIIAFIDIACNAVSGHVQMSCNAGTETIWANTYGVNSTAGQTSLSEVSIHNTSGTFLAGTRLDVYKINI